MALRKKPNGQLVRATETTFAMGELWRPLDLKASCQFNCRPMNDSFAGISAAQFRRAADLKEKIDASHRSNTPLFLRGFSARGHCH